MKQKILILEEDPSLRYLLKMHLEAAEYEVTVASHLSECLNVCKSIKPVLILMELRSTDKSFSAFFPEIKNNPSIYGIPVIVGITTNEESEFIASYLKVKGEIDSVFRKPFEFEDLNREVTKLLTGVRGRTQTGTGKK
ncbi:MAG: response regulator [Candidatus Aureabacteria bacterium]|nr:response regulator [Candidatus Auribacterota bacterium]